MVLKDKYLATAIGSLPHQDPQAAVDLMLENLSTLPVWPQLPKLNFRESMYAQFSEGLPNVIIDEQKGSMFVNVDERLEELLAERYEKFIAGDLEYFTISQPFAAGFYKFVEVLNTKKSTPLYLKGQVTGPMSFGLTITDQNKKSIFYNPTFSDFLPKFLLMKTRWQIKRLKMQSPNSEIIIFIDEPYLVSLGSGFVNVNSETIKRNLNEIIEAIHQDGALAGIHCCANTDWSLILDSAVDILSFDAYNYIEHLALYPKKVAEFLSRGGVLAWGIVPNSAEIRKNSVESLAQKFFAGSELLEKKGVEREKILNAALITPSCGCGTLTQDLAEEVIKSTGELANYLREKGA